MSDAQSLARLLRDDAEAVAGLLRQRRGDREQRREARALLAASFALMPAPSGEDPDATPTAPDPEALLAAALAMARTRRALGDDARSSAWPIGKLWIRAPMPQRLLTLVFVAQRERLVAAIEQKLDVPLALSEARIAWAEARCNVEQPGVVREVRTADSPESERLLASELELLRKRGRSRFS